MSEPEPQPLSDADLIAWSVVFTHRAHRERDGINLLLLPYPACPTCGQPVHAAEQIVREHVEPNIRLTVQPCGHVHTASDEDVNRLWLYIDEMVRDVTSDYHGYAVVPRRWTTEEIVREARARAAGTAIEGDSYPAPEPECDAEQAVTCCVCGGRPIDYRNFREMPFCWACADCGCGQDPCVRTGINASPSEKAEAEVARLRAGEEPGWEPGVVPTPGQWIARWNEASAKERLEVARQVIDAQLVAADCVLKAHEKRISVTDKALAASGRTAREAQATVARVRAEVARIRAVTPTWGPVADLIDAALSGAVREQRVRPTHPDGTPYSYYEITAEGWGFCDGCRMWSTATPDDPHQCSTVHVSGPASEETPDV